MHLGIQGNTSASLLAFPKDLKHSQYKTALDSHRGIWWEGLLPAAPRASSASFQLGSFKDRGCHSASPNLCGVLRAEEHKESSGVSEAFSAALQDDDDDCYYYYYYYHFKAS